MKRSLRAQPNPVSCQRRNNVHVSGGGPATLVFAHGFGCDQNMWRLMAPRYAASFRTVLYDLTGSGASDTSAYKADGRHATLHGHAADLNEVVAEFADPAVHGPVILVGHSVSAMVGLLADLSGPPGRVAAHVMIGPSPCYIDDGDYVGGFARADIDSLLETLESNYLGWASNMAPAIMGAPEQPELGVELSNSFCRTDPQIARHFARVTFLSDQRADLPRLQTPTLILQCTDDIIAPQSVGHYMQATLPRATLRLIENTGHCPHLSAPSASAEAVDGFLQQLGH